jgi:hypothetical protein
MMAPHGLSSKKWAEARRAGMKGIDSLAHLLIESMNK